MHVLLVQIRVRPEALTEFREATLANARASLQEPGVARFDVLQQTDDPTLFVLVEVYRNPEAVWAHKQTAHFDTWRRVAEPLMAEPRSRLSYTGVFPPDSGWAAAR